MNLFKFLKNFIVGCLVVAVIVVVPTLIGLALEAVGTLENVERPEFYWFAGVATMVVVAIVAGIGSVFTGDTKIEGGETGYDY